MQQTAITCVSTIFQALLDRLSPLLTASPDVALERLQTVLPASVKPTGVLKLALASDFLRTIRLDLAGRCIISHDDFGAAAAFVGHCAKLFHRTGRPFYAEFQNAAEFKLDHFVSQHRRYPELFGGLCQQTEWAGFSIVRASAIHLKDPSLIDLYEKYLFSWQTTEFDCNGIHAGPWVVQQLIRDAKAAMNFCSIDSQGSIGPFLSLSNQKEISVATAFTDRVFRFEVQPLRGPAMFEIRESSESLKMVINANHPLAESLQIVVANNGHSDRGLQKLFHAWARLENGSGDARRRLLEDIRYDWGRLAREVSDEDSLCPRSV